MAVLLEFCVLSETMEGFCDLCWCLIREIVCLFARIRGNCQVVEKEGLLSGIGCYLPPHVLLFHLCFVSLVRSEM